MGLGRIGQATAKRLGAFGINRLVYWGRTKKEGVDGDLVSLDQLLEQSDFVLVSCPLTPDTKELFDYAAFKKMKKNAVSGKEESVILRLISFTPRSLSISLAEV